MAVVVVTWGQTTFANSDNQALVRDFCTGGSFSCTTCHTDGFATSTQCSAAPQDSFVNCTAEQIQFILGRNVGGDYCFFCPGDPCSDGDTCTTTDTCAALAPATDPVSLRSSCVGGPALDCDDGDACTADACDPSAGCVHVPIAGCQACATDADCDDGLFCNGAETCDATGGCQAGMNPCAPGEQCDEILQCIPHLQCATDADCDDGVFCNGAEQCSDTFRCLQGATPCAAGEICNEVDHCVPAPGCLVDADCDDGIFCNGAEVCKTDATCGPGTPPCESGQVCTELDGCAVADDGPGLYADHCASCHGLDGSGGAVREDVRGACPDQIVEAIAEVGQMRFLDLLTDAQIESIADFLGCRRDGGDDDGSEDSEDSDDGSDDDASDASEEGCCGHSRCFTDADCNDDNVCNGTETCDQNSNTCVSGRPLVCDDGDPCTEDVCHRASGCSSGPVGFPALSRSFKADLAVAACNAQLVPAKIRKLFAKAEVLVQRSAASGTARAKSRFVKKAALTLDKAGRKATRAGQRRISPDCAAALGTVIGAVRSQAECLRRSL